MNKKIFKVEITETLQKVIDVKALTQEEALFKVKKDYHDQKIVLDYSDYIDTEIDLFDENPQKIKTPSEIVSIIEQHFEKHIKEYNKQTAIENKSKNVVESSNAHKLAYTEAVITCFIYELLADINDTGFDYEANRLHKLYDK